MAQVRIRVYQNNKFSSAYGKFYGRVQHSTEISVEKLCAYVAMDSGVEQAQVAIVFDAVAKQIKEQLCNGHPIKVEGIGTFKVGISSGGWGVEEVKELYPSFNLEKDDIRKCLSASDFRAGKDIEKIRLILLPDKEIKKELKNMKFEKFYYEDALAKKEAREAANAAQNQPTGD